MGFAALGPTGPTAPTTAEEMVEAARMRDAAFGWSRPLIALAAACVAITLLAVGMAVLGPAAAPVDARSTSAPTGEPVPAVQLVDMGPRRTWQPQ